MGGRLLRVGLERALVCFGFGVAEEAARASR
jgi:hypothetical protein